MQPRSPWPILLTGSNPAQPKCGTKSWASQLHPQAGRFQGYQAVLGLVCPCSPRSWRRPPRLRGHVCFVALFAGCPPGWGHLPGCFPRKRVLCCPPVSRRGWEQPLGGSRTCGNPRSPAGGGCSLPAPKCPVSGTWGCSLPAEKPSSRCQPASVVLDPAPCSPCLKSQPRKGENSLFVHPQD